MYFTYNPPKEVLWVFDKDKDPLRIFHWLRCIVSTFHVEYDFLRKYYNWNLSHMVFPGTICAKNDILGWPSQYLYSFWSLVWIPHTVGHIISCVRHKFETKSGPNSIFEGPSQYFYSRLSMVYISGYNPPNAGSWLVHASWAAMATDSSIWFFVCLRELGSDGYCRNSKAHWRI